MKTIRVKPVIWINFKTVDPKNLSFHKRVEPILHFGWFLKYAPQLKGKRPNWKKENTLVELRLAYTNMTEAGGPDQAIYYNPQSEVKQELWENQRL